MATDPWPSPPPPLLRSRMQFSTSVYNSMSDFKESLLLG